MDTTIKRCVLCGRESGLIIEHLSVCAQCVRTRRDEAFPFVRRAHADARRAFGLPEEPPRTPGGMTCPLCGQGCVIGPEERGYCGLRVHRAVGSSGRRRLGHLAGTPARGVLHWYRDPLPSNCVADWVCAGSRQRGRHNLAVFYASCTLDCLYCQNWHYREVDPAASVGLSARSIALGDRPRCKLIEQASHPRPVLCGAAVPVTGLPLLRATHVIVELLRMGAFLFRGRRSQPPSTGAFYGPTLDVRRCKATAPEAGAWSNSELAPKVKCAPPNRAS